MAVNTVEEVKEADWKQNIVAFHSCLPSKIAVACSSHGGDLEILWSPLVSSGVFHEAGVSKNFAYFDKSGLIK